MAETSACVSRDKMLNRVIASNSAGVPNLIAQFIAVQCLNLASSLWHPACIHIYAEINDPLGPPGVPPFLAQDPTLESRD